MKLFPDDPTWKRCYISGMYFQGAFFAFCLAMRLWLMDMSGVIPGFLLLLVLAVSVRFLYRFGNRYCYSPGRALFCVLNPSVLIVVVWLYLYEWCISEWSVSVFDAVGVVMFYIVLGGLGASFFFYAFMYGVVRQKRVDMENGYRDLMAGKYDEAIRKPHLDSHGLES